MALYSLKCHTPGCTYKTPELPESLCSQDINNHIAAIHTNIDHDHLPSQSSGTVSSTTAPEDLKPQSRLPSSTSSLEAEFIRPPNSTTDVVITEQILSQDGAQHALDIGPAHISLPSMKLM